MKKVFLIAKRIPLVILVIVSCFVLFVFGFLGQKMGYRHYEFAMGDSYVGLLFQGLHDGVLPWDEPKEEVTVQQEIATPQEIELPETEGYLSAEEEARLRNVSVVRVIKERQEASKGAYVHADTAPEGVNSQVVEAYDYGTCDEIRLTPEGVSYAPLDTEIFRENKDYYLQAPAEDMDYFWDALFIGDSRTYGLVEHTDMVEHAIFFAQESLNIYDLEETEVEPTTPGGVLPKQRLEDVLAAGDFGKIYICIGVNELGTGNTVTFYNTYVSLIEKIRHYQPDAIIYVQGIMHVSEAKAKDTIYNNTNILDKNRAIATLANGHDIFYLDMNADVCDAAGNLRTDLTNDGVHLAAQYYVLWEDYIKAHVIYRNEGDAGKNKPQE